ncbi:UDP-N-acetylmuramoylalanyl-D-glutamyl-2,6-diaminopimelate--D-alanyl-D-alanine ligase [soil metagenome]
MADAPLWTIEAILAATGGTLRGTPTGPLNGVAIDNRAVAPGDIFCAIKGDRHDGHEFAEAALKSGAGLAIVSRPTDAMAAAGPLLVAGDPLQALVAMGRASRERSHAIIIAITGSVGKTSTKETLRLALSASGMTHASASSFNNHWGVPISLARMPVETAYGVFEIGMNHPGEITPLTQLVRPHIAIITNIAPSHLGYFSSLAEIADAKAEIFAGMRPGGHAVLNRDSPYFDQLAAAAAKEGVTDITGFGRHPDAQVRLERLVLHPDCCCVTAEVMGEKLIYKLGVPGEHMALNSLAVLAAVKLAGADLARAGIALAAARPAKGRGTRSRLRVAGGDALLIDESYNANPVSVRAALALLKQASPGARGRRIAILGDMLELGNDAPAMHRDLAEALDGAKVDLLYAAGPLMAHLWDAIPPHRRGAYADQSESLKAPLLQALAPGDVVMIKGSLGSRMGPLVEAMKQHYGQAGEE